MFIWISSKNFRFFKLISEILKNRLEGHQGMARVRLEADHTRAKYCSIHARTHTKGGAMRACIKYGTVRSILRCLLYARQANIVLECQFDIEVGCESACPLVQSPVHIA